MTTRCQFENSGQDGKTAEAAEAAAALIRLDPQWQAEARFMPSQEKDRQLLAQCAAKAGLPVCMTAAQIEPAKPAWPFEEREKERARAATVS